MFASPGTVCLSRRPAIFRRAKSRFLRWQNMTRGPGVPALIIPILTCMRLNQIADGLMYFFESYFLGPDKWAFHGRECYFNLIQVRHDGEVLILIEEDVGGLFGGKFQEIDL